MIAHFTVTWLLANLLHPFIMWVYFGGSGFSSAPELFGIVFMIIVYSFIFSIPSLFLSYLAGYLISLMPLEKNMQYLVWLVTAPAIAFVNFLLITALLSGKINFEEIGFSVPAMIAVIIAVLFRFKQFVHLNNKHKNDQPETTMG